jgi:uncharacterized protein (DUF885 family)
MAERIVDGLLTADPGLAHQVGDHRFDDRLPDFSADAVADRISMLRDAAGALSGVDTDGLDAAERVDHEQLLAHVERVLFALTDVREHEWNPLTHNPGGLLDALMSRPFAPAAQRLEALAARLAAVPDLLATARATLSDCPRIHLETAVGQFRGAASVVTSQLPGLVAEVPDLAGLVEPVARTAVTQLEEFAAWAQVQAAATSAGRDPRLGRRLWEAKLWHRLDTDLTAAEVLARARENLTRVTGEIRVAAARLIGGRADDDTVREALHSLGAQHPNNTTIVALARQSLAEATAFVREHNLISLVDDPCVVREMPEYARGVAVATCESAGAFDAEGVPSYFNIAPTPADWSAERVESFYREYNDHMVANLTVHEAMPGHFLELAHARRYRGSTRVRAVTASGVFIEGWAVYAEELMAAHGFGGLKVLMQQLKMQLRMSINAILDQLVHCEELTEGEAMALMTQRGFQEEGEAAGKWRRALLTSTQLSTYFVGYVEVAAVAAARPAGMTECAWHDAIVGQGSPSPRHLRSLVQR